MRYNTFLMVQQYPYHSRRNFGHSSFVLLAPCTLMSSKNLVRLQLINLICLTFEFNSKSLQTIDSTLNDDYDNYHPSSGSHCPETP